MPPSKRPARRLPPTDPVDEVEEDEAEEEEEEEAPAPPKATKTRRATPDDNGDNVIKGGWLNAQQTMDSTSSYAQSLKLEEKTQVIKFLEDTPYANYLRHWVERTTQDGKTLRAHVCPKTVKKECPLCEIGERPQAVSAFNIALVGENGEVLHKTWDVTPRLFGVIKGYGNDPKVGPLTKGFFIASKTGKRGTVQHNIAPVSRHALEEDYNTEPPDQKELDGLERYGPEIIEVAKYSLLKELAEELSAYED